MTLHYFPYAYSRAWRLLYSSGFVIIKKYAYVKAISKNRLMAIALVLLVVEAALSFVFSTVKPSTRIRSQFVIKVISILITISSYLYLLHNVRKNTKNVTAVQKIKGSTNARIERQHIAGWWFYASKIVTLMRVFYFTTSTKITKCSNEEMMKVKFQKALGLWKAQTIHLQWKAQIVLAQLL